MVAVNPKADYLQGSVQPSLWVSRWADAAAALAFGCAITAVIAGAPKPIKTITLGAALGASIAAWRTNSDPALVDAQIASDAIRESRLRATNAELVDSQAVAAQHREVETAKQVLISIAEAPVALQPLLLEQAGFKHLIPRLYGQSQSGYKAPAAESRSLKSAAVAEARETAFNQAASSPEFIEDIEPTTGIEALPERDLASEIVAQDVPALLVGESGSGKTGLILDAIQSALVAQAHVQILDAKNSAVYDYIRTQHPEQITYHACAGVEGAESALDILRGLNKVMLARNDADSAKYRPMLIVLDEVNVALDVAVGAKLDQTEGRDSLSAAIKSEIRTLANQGRTRKFRLLLSSHSYSLKQLGMDGASHHAVALARKGNLRAVDAVLKALSRQQSVRAIKESLNEIRSEVNDTPVALTSLPAEGLYRLPYQPRTNTGKPKQQQQRSQPVDSFEDDFAELDDSERLDDLADLINLRSWWVEQGPVNDAELLEHWNTVAEQPLALVRRQ